MGGVLTHTVEPEQGCSQSSNIRSIGLSGEVLIPGYIPVPSLLSYLTISRRNSLSMNQESGLISESLAGKLSEKIECLFAIMQIDYVFERKAQFGIMQIL